MAADGSLQEWIDKLGKGLVWTFEGIAQAGKALRLVLQPVGPAISMVANALGATGSVVALGAVFAVRPVMKFSKKLLSLGGTLLRLDGAYCPSCGPRS